MDSPKSDSQFTTDLVNSHGQCQQIPRNIIRLSLPTI